MKRTVGIIGVTGYSGQELLKILLSHPMVSIEYLGARSVKNRPRPMGEVLPQFRGAASLSIHPLNAEDAARRCEILFLCLPHGVAMGIVPRIIKKRKELRVIDLSGDFRLRSAGSYEQAYRIRHRSPALLKGAAYGLPEWRREAIRSARIVANPGCYATAALLGAVPLAKAGLLKGQGLIVDAKSGVTGAGRSLKEELLFTEVNEDLRAYRVNAHQHMPEMEQELRRVSGRSIRLTFVPHLVPLNRGIYATIYAPLARRLTEARLRAIYERRYGGEPFIRILPAGTWPEVKSVAGTNFCDIGLRLDPKGNQAIILVAIDNLGKGAAGQAVQNMNLMCGIPEAAGLLACHPRGSEDRFSLSRE
ncbi:MAG: N-acetyl-gamma-glutamyl-phosphate reductase [Candidatus Omnitrophica bacterium]|nr:N-acetyl-gamma-glutamyl-phosphate reductase [Candidatus Omnitrophota bacterium]